MARHVCPVWVGYFLASPLRKLSQNPKAILNPYVREGMIALDIGCAMGFFSLPLAERVGPAGKVVCLDVQEKMTKKLEKRARKAGLLDRIETRICPPGSLGIKDLKEQIDFGLAFSVVHEVPDAQRFFSELYETIKCGGKVLVAEPKGHVSREDFEVSVSIAGKIGFVIDNRPNIARSRTVIVTKE